MIDFNCLSFCDNSSNKALSPSEYANHGETTRITPDEEESDAFVMVRISPSAVYAATLPSFLALMFITFCGEGSALRYATPGTVLWRTSAIAVPIKRMATMPA